MAKIFIEARNILSGDADAVNDSSFQHLYLVYQDDGGTEYVIRGGPTNKIFTPAWLLEGFGPIIVVAGDTLLDSKDERLDENDKPISPETRGQIELDLGGRDAADVWNIMVQQAQQLADENIFYNLDIQNSNSVISTVLNAVGITNIPRPNGESYPGSGTILGSIIEGGYFFDVDYEFLGTSSDDVMRGAQGNDQIEGFEGDDAINGWLGNDILIGGTGSDHLIGGAGDDFLFAGNRDVSEFEYARDADGNVLLGTIPDEPTDGSPDDFSSWDDGEADYLEGGFGFDHYFVGAAGATETGGGWDDDRTIRMRGDDFNENVYNHIDVIRDTDGQGTIWYSLDGLEDIGLNIYFRELTPYSYTKSDYQLVGRDSWGDVLIDRYTNPQSGVTADRLVFFESETYHALFAIDGFQNGDFGITLEGYEPGAIEALDDETTNSIDGTRGDDTINAYGGDDTVQGYAGADIINGGTGIDTALYSQSLGGVTVNLKLETAFGGDAAGDVLISIENLTGSDYADTLIGNYLNNVLFGGLGNDTLNGGGGNDFLDGGEGNNTVNAGDGDDTIYAGGTGTIDGGTGTDRLVLKSASDIYEIEGRTVTITTAIGTIVATNIEEIQTWDGTIVPVSTDVGSVIDGTSLSDDLIGTDGDDTINGLEGNDTVEGGAGADVLNGGAGADALDGGAGIDWAKYTGSTEGVIVILPSGTGWGGDAEGDTLVNIERVSGSNHDDVFVGDDLDNWLFGEEGNDNFYGGGGNDRIVGGGGNDIIIGEGGHDILEGGAGNDHLDGVDGNDVFVYDGTDLGSDGIANFEAGSDMIQFSASTGITNYSELQDAMRQDLLHTIIEFGDNSSITLYEIDMSTLDASDFAFVQG